MLAADKHLTALAQAMKAAGTTGTLDVLRAIAYLHLLSGQPARPSLPHPAQRPATRPDGHPRPAPPRPPHGTRLGPGWRGCPPGSPTHLAAARDCAAR